MNINRIKGYCAVSAFTVVLYLVLSNLHRLNGVLGKMASLFSPFIIGVVIAFILNGVMNQFEQKVFYRMGNHKNPKVAKMVRPLSLLSTYIVMIVAFTIVLTVVVPQLATSIVQLGNNIPAYLTSMQQLAERIAVEITLPPDVWAEINTWFQGAAKSLLDFVVAFVPQMLTFVISLGGGMFNVAIGIIVSIYLLMSKEHLLSQLARLNRAFLPKRFSDWSAHAGHISAATFGNYVAGQLLDALIVGIVSVLGLSILQFPYAMLIGVVMGITNVIPFFGPFIGAVPGFFIILMVDPVKALWYILFVVVLQQVDGNIIAPKIIGESVGLPAIWVLFAVTVGGGLFGVGGMILGTPVFAIIYILIGRATRIREIPLQVDPAKE